MRNHTILFDNPVYIVETSSIVGPKEGKGPLKNYFSHILKDDLLKQKSFEQAEIKIHTSAIKQLLNKANLNANQIDCFFCGDLLDEIVGSSFTMREIDAPFLGLYNACATFGEALILASTMISTKTMSKVVCSISSHYATAERQFRFPLELGTQKTPLSQWTVTGGTSILLSNELKTNVKITSGTIGKVIDFGVTDANDMGAAMAPAALDTLLSHLNDMQRDVDYYDLIMTGDLGHAGSRLLEKLANQKGIHLNINENYTDGGVLIFNRESQYTNQGGSGASCGALCFNTYVYTQIKRGKYKKVLFIPTGALLSKISSLQGESIPGIAHAVSVEVE